MAVEEWESYYLYGGEKEGRMIDGPLYCFCQNVYKKSSINTYGMEWLDEKGHSVHVCDQWVKDKFIQMGVSYAITGLIVFVNWFLKIIIVKLVNLLHHKTVTKTTKSVMIFVFVAQFVNTGVLIFLNDASFADLDGGSGPLSKIFVKGQ